MNRCARIAGRRDEAAMSVKGTVDATSAVLVTLPRRSEQTLSTMRGRGRMRRAAPWLSWSVWLLGSRQLDARLCAVRGARRYTVRHVQDRVVPGPPLSLRLCDRRGRGRVPPARQRHRLALLRDRPGADPRRVRGSAGAIGPCRRPQLRTRLGGPVLARRAWCWELSWALLALLLLLFPTGRLPSRRWRPVAWAAGAVLLLAALSSPLLAWPTGRGPAAEPDRDSVVGGCAPAGLCHGELGPLWGDPGRPGLAGCAVPPGTGIERQQVKSI